MTSLADRIEDALAIGGMKKEIALLAISAISLIISLVAKDMLPFDPAWIAVVLCGTPILIESSVGLFLRLNIKADVLVSIALIASLCLGEIFAAGEVAAIMVIGALLEDYTSEKANRNIRKLIDMKPNTARIIVDGEDRVVDVDEVRTGDLLRVVAGESVPVDGIIVSGITSIDQSMMTGESVPVDKTVGDEVMSGTINQFGVFEMRATKEAEDSSLERMIVLIEQADADRAPVVRLADKWATWFVLIALCAAVGAYIVTSDITRAVTVLVVFCPCAFILATPTAVVAAIGNATRHGFLVRSGASMEALAGADTVTFDKTGTLTYGTPSVREVKGLSGHSDDDVHRLFAIAEKRSEHPLGRAIVRSYDGNIDDPEDFKVLPGKGVSCMIEGHRILAGNLALMKESGTGSDTASLSDRCRNGGITVFLSVDGVLSGLVTLEDVIRDDCSVTVDRIKRMSIRPVLMTGDNRYVAAKVAASAGILDVIPECLPEDKLNRISELQSGGSTVCMVGDGINDAPALKRADIGISMGGVGSDIAIDASDITLVNDDISQIPHILALSKRMMRKININLALSIILNMTGVILAMFAILNPISAAIFHNVGSVFVVVNSALLLGWRSSFDWNSTRSLYGGGTPHTRHDDGPSPIKLS